MSAGGERAELTLIEVREGSQESEVGQYLLTPVRGGTSVIVSEVEDLDGGQAINPVGVYEPNTEAAPAFFGGPIIYTLRPIPEELVSTIGVVAVHSPGKRMVLKRIENSPTKP